MKVLACIYVALLCCVKDINAAATYTMLVNDQEIVEANGVRGGLDAGLDISVACQADPNIPKPDMKRIIPGRQDRSLQTYLQTKYVGSNKEYIYALNDTDKRVTATYRCIDEEYTDCPDYSQVTISFTTPSPRAGATIPNCPPGGSSDRPSVNPPSSPSSNPSSNPSSRPTVPSSSGGTAGPGFSGLNPLIYTISAVILLGTLAIVAIITCWIRARRSYNRRMFQSTTNPQDYLDYISDNEFTPLTTSEFVASLQERPPTYNESEEIQGQMGPGEGSAENGTGAEGTAGGGAETDTGGAETDTDRGGAGGRAQSTTMTTNARSPPPRPPPPSTTINSNRSQPITSSGTTAVVASLSNEDTPDVTSALDAPNVTSEDCSLLIGGGITRSSLSSEPSQLTSSSTENNDEEVPDVTEDNAATGCSSSEPMLSGVDALLSMDLNTGNGNGTYPLPILPASSSSSGATQSGAVGALIDLGISDSGSSAPAISDSQSTFHSVPQPTPEQISEIEAAIGTFNEHMTRIRERTE